VNEIPLSALIIALLALLALSAFFSASETGLMSLNRYRLRHLAQAGHRSARLTEDLLTKPDRVIGFILIANNLANTLASMVTTLIALRLFGESGLGLAAAIIALAIIIFSEVTPKTAAALHAERVALPAAYILWPLLRIFYPVVWLVNAMAKAVLWLLRIRSTAAEGQLALSSEELRTVVIEAGAMIPKRHQRMLLSVLDLEKATVEDIMIPRSDIVGIDVTDSWDRILENLTSSQHTRMPLFEESIDNIVGVVHIRRILADLQQNRLTKEILLEKSRNPYFIPQGTPLNTQLLNFQRQRRRIGLVVDEYGDIQGLVTLEDILEEIVGEFTSDPANTLRGISRQPDGSYLIEASITIRTLNRLLGWDLPTAGPKTLNGLILEHMEAIPEPATSMRFSDYTVEIVKTSESSVKAVRITPPPRRSGSRRVGNA